MNKTNLIVTLTVATAFLAIIGSCKKDKGKEPVATTTTTGTTGATGCDTVTYTKYIKPITDGNCAIAGCHNGSTSYPLLISYDDVKKQAENGRIKARVIDENPSRMPPASLPALSAAQKALITCWLSNGYKQ